MYGREFALEVMSFRALATSADCAITAAADYIVTEDRHFEALRNSGYQPQPITPEEFIPRFLP